MSLTEEQKLDYIQRALWNVLSPDNQYALYDTMIKEAAEELKAVRNLAAQLAEALEALDLPEHRVPVTMCPRCAGIMGHLEFCSRAALQAWKEYNDGPE